MILHSLNALRVILEYIIVSHHITDFGFRNAFVHSYGVTNSLMSFFFVLSGFVAMHTTDGKDSTYLTRRLRKTYPFYILMWISGLPPTIYGNIWVSECKVQSWLYLALQPLCIQIFLGWQIEGSNIPAWYYTVLVFLWAFHSLFDLKYWIKDHPLKYMVLFYATSVLMSIPFLYFDRESVKQLPLFRILEFWMGAAVAISFKNGYEIRGEIAFLGFVFYIVFSIFTVTEHEFFGHNIQNGTCTFWKKDNEFTFQANGFNTITSILWATIIHWLACSESRGDSNVFMSILSLDVFKSMAKFSLQLYLSHWVTTTYLYHILRELGIITWFSKDFHVLFAYTSSYALYNYIQPKLDFWFNKINISQINQV